MGYSRGTRGYVLTGYSRVLFSRRRCTSPTWSRSPKSERFWKYSYALMQLSMSDCGMVCLFQVAQPRCGWLARMDAAGGRFEARPRKDGRINRSPSHGITRKVSGSAFRRSFNVINSVRVSACGMASLRLALTDTQTQATHDIYRDCIRFRGNYTRRARDQKQCTARRPGRPRHVSTGLDAAMPHSAAR